MGAVRSQMSGHRVARIDRAIASWGHARRRRASPTEPSWEAVELEECVAECEVAWLAGVLEGEGTFGVARSGQSSYPTISVQMCDESVVRRASRLLRAP